MGGSKFSFTIERWARVFECTSTHFIYSRDYKVPPGKVLVIGAGVAGLSAIATVRLSNRSVHYWGKKPNS